MAEWTFQIEAGEGWIYDRTDLAYDAETEPLSGDEVYYDSIGTATEWSNQTKN